jgi:hypothetical protein
MAAVVKFEAGMAYWDTPVTYQPSKICRGRQLIQAGGQTLGWEPRWQFEMPDRRQLLATSKAT